MGAADIFCMCCRATCRPPSVLARPCASAQTWTTWSGTRRSAPLQSVLLRMLHMQRSQRLVACCELLSSRHSRQLHLRRQQQDCSRQQQRGSWVAHLRLRLHGLSRAHHTRQQRSNTQRQSMRRSWMQLCDCMGRWGTLLWLSLLSGTTSSPPGVGVASELW